MSIPTEHLDPIPNHNPNPNKGLLKIARILLHAGEDPDIQSNPNPNPNPNQLKLTHTYHTNLNPTYTKGQMQMPVIRVVGL